MAGMELPTVGNLGAGSWTSPETAIHVSGEVMELTTVVNLGAGSWSSARSRLHPKADYRPSGLHFQEGRSFAGHWIPLLHNLKPI